MRTCKECKQELSLKNFYLHGKYYSSYCKRCSIVKNRQWAQRNPEKRYATHKKWRKKYHNHPKLKSHQMLDGMVARSKTKGFARPEFTAKEIENIIAGGKCSKTGMEFRFDQSEFSKSPWTPVPDRINSAEGYTKENVQWVCQVYNSAKQDFTDSIVLEFAQALLDKGNF